tara:strand:- start:150 stop:698 length:549 start_codon:yes stop_codon:yes gene_type:complete
MEWVNQVGDYMVSRNFSDSERPIPDTVLRVTTFLEQAGIEASLHEFYERTPTAKLAARAVGCKMSQVVKSLIFACDRELTLVMVGGDLRVDKAKICSFMGVTAAKIVKPEVVFELTGFKIGGVPPFPLPSVDRALCDTGLLAETLVWAGAGSDRHMVELRPYDLLRLSRAIPADIGCSKSSC